MVQDVRRDDANDIDAILERRLGPGHVAKIGVAARSNPLWSRRQQAFARQAAGIGNENSDRSQLGAHFIDRGSHLARTATSATTPSADGPEAEISPASVSIKAGLRATKPMR